MGDRTLSDSDLALLGRAPLFCALSRSGLGALLEQAAVQRLARDTVLFEQGEAAAAFYLVLEGWVKLFRRTPAGEEAIVGIFARGDSFGEAVCFAEGLYPVSGQAVTDCRLLAISARRIAEHIRADPDIGLAMLAATSQHLQMLVRQIEELKAQTGAQRLAEFLIGLAPVQRGPCTIMLPYEKTLIAGRLGMKPESLSRAFQRIRSVGVRVDQNVVAVRDVALLASFAGQERATVFKCAQLGKTCGERPRWSSIPAANGTP